jgi:hypothetical protein
LSRNIVVAGREIYSKYHLFIVAQGKSGEKREKEKETETETETETGFYIVCIIE